MAETATGFSTTPIGAKLFVNNNLVATTPYGAYWFKAGDRIRIELAGYKTLSFILTADRIGKSNYYLLVKEAELPVPAKTYGDVGLSSSPSNAKIFVDGKDTGKTTPKILTIETGLRTITLKKEGYNDLSWVEIVEPVSKQLPTKILVQVPIPTPAPAPTPAPEISPFIKKWNEIVADAKAGNWLKVIAGVVVLPALSMLPGDVEVLQGTVPISPAAGLEAYLAVSETAATAQAVAKGAGFFSKFSKLKAMFSGSAGLSKLWWAIAGIIGLDGIMSWAATDNIITGTSFTLIKLREAAEAGTITKEEALAQLDRVQKWKDYATTFLKVSTIVNPLLWIFRGILLTNAEKGQDDINLEKTKIEAIITKKQVPEVVKAVVSDIIDGDTITVRRHGEAEVLPEYSKTGHVRVRIIGINAPEKSPKGEIICTDIELYGVEAKWADASRKELLPLSEKEVTLYIDPENAVDDYNRVLAKVVYAGTDIALSQIKKGLACYYAIGKNKYVDDAGYKQATITARENKVGMWKAVAMKDFKIKITSLPSNAKIYIDGTYTHHLTPADETELSDVMELLEEGKRKIKVEKGELSKERDINIENRDMGTINFVLEAAAAPEKAVVEAPEEMPAAPEEEVPAAPPPVEAPTLKEFYDELGTYVAEGKRLTRKEWEAIGVKYGLTQLGAAPAKAETIQDLYLIVGTYVVGKTVLTEKEWKALGAALVF